MSFSRYSMNHSSRGSSILAILIVIAIILVIVMAGPMDFVPETQVTQAQNNIEKSADAACAVNRNSIRTDLTQMVILNNAQMPDIETLRQRFRQTCPRGGAYMLDPDSRELYCTQHYPPPAQLLTKLVTLREEVVETPPALPVATPMQ